MVENDKYYYVWLAAPIGYISSTKHYCTRLGLRWEDYWLEDTGRVIHFIGKDIIYFPFLFWPAMLMGAGFNLPDRLVVHGFLTVNKEKMSTSRGTFITAREYLETMDPAYLRYYYAANLSPKMADLDLDLRDLKNRINGELIGNFANFANRSLTFLVKNFDSRICKFSEPELEKEVLERCRKILEYYRRVDFRNAVREMLEISDIGNRYFQEKAPWALIKENHEAAHQVVSFTVNLVRILGILFKPIIPVVCNRLERQLALPHQDFSNLAFDLTGHVVGEPSPLISKIDKVELIRKDPFASIELRVGVIEEAASHPKADKLVVMQVDLGNEKRQLIAGIRQFYTDEELRGKKIVVVTNLKPAKLRGIKSQGMLLAASNEKELGVLTVDAELGSPVRPSGIEFDGSSQITIDDFMKVTLTASEGRALYKETTLMAEEVEVEVDRGVTGGIS